MLIQLLNLFLLIAPVQNQADEVNSDPAEAAQSQPAASQPAGGIIEGIVTNSMGGGVLGAKVRLEHAEPPHALIAEGTTNAVGELAIPLAEPIRETITARARIMADGYGPFLQEVELVPDEELPYIDATLTGASKLRGQVRRYDDNAPVPNAQVRCTTGGRDLTATTDARGRFTLEGVDRGAAVLIVNADGWATQRQEVKVEDDETNVFVELNPQRPLRIVAKRSDGQPARDLLIELMLQPSEYWMQATTDTQGLARLQGVSAATESILMRYNGPGYVQMSGFEKAFTLPRPQPTGTAPASYVSVDIPVEVSLAAQVRGTVVDASGRPVLGVRVIAGREPYGYMPMVWTAQDGTYELEGVPPGPNVISFQHGDHATLIQECTLDTGQTLTMNATLDAGRQIRARVIDESGQPIANAWITVESWKGYTTLGMRTISAKDGTFIFLHAPEGELEISIERPGYSSAREKFTAGAPGRDVALKKSAGADERPEPPARVAKLNVGDAVPELVMSATDGKTYKLSDLKGKHVFIECWASWCGPCMAEMPNIKALRTATKDNKDFIMIGINLDRERQAFDAAVRKLELNWPQVTGPGSGAEKTFGTLDGFAIPYSCLIGPDGKLVARDLRGPNLAEEVNKLVK